LEGDGVVGVPSLEAFHDPTTIRVVGFDDLNPFNRIATAKRYKCTSRHSRRCNISAAIGGEADIDQPLFTSLDL
jgi:hypothetical protein